MLSGTRPPTYERLSINVAWLIKLRWVAAVGQLTTILVVQLVLGIEIALRPLLLAVGITALSNLVFDVWARQRRGDFETSSTSLWYGVIGSVMLLDLLVLTSLLYFTGGLTNPFSIFYFVNLALAGMLLPPPWAWFLNGVATAGLALLCYQHIPVPVLQRPERLQSIVAAGGVSPAGQGLFVAFVTCSSVIVYFTTRLTGELQQREQDLRRAEMLRARSEKLEALGTLAAGAAHELATPLSTIAVVAKEVQRELKGQDMAEIVVKDIALIRSELDRCRSILDRLSVSSGHVVGEPLVTVTTEELVEQVLAGMATQCPIRADFASGTKQKTVSVPLTGVAQALRGVLQNAADANRGPEPVRLKIDTDAEYLRLDIQDRGTGMNAEVLARAGEPFFTTKEPGKGMGLGLFLARSVIERLGGTLQIHSSVGQGTTVVIRLALTQS